MWSCRCQKACFKSWPKLADTDLGVCRAACELAGKSGHHDFRRPLLEIIATENHELLQLQLQSLDHSVTADLCVTSLVLWG